MSKKIYLKDSREKLLEGINLIADAVQSTLGPSGKTVIIYNQGEDPYATKDGVTVANEVSHPDPVMNAAIMLFKKVSSKMDTDFGDGTTTVSVICRELIKLGLELQESNTFNEHVFKETIEMCLRRTIVELNQLSVQIDVNDIRKIAYTSSNNDAEIADLFEQAFARSGKEGHINIVTSVNGNSYVDIINGYVLDMGYAERKYGNNSITGFFEAKKAYVLLYDGELTNRKETVNIINFFNKRATQLPIIIIAKDFSKDALQIIDFNNLDRSGNDICIIKNQLRNQENVDFLNDVSEYTGAEICTNFDEFDYDPGLANDVIVKDGVTVLGPNKETRLEILNAYIERLQAHADNEKTGAYVEQIRKRISKMTNGVITYYVGGDSDIEIKEKRHRVDDAYNACKHALNGNVIMGGGQALAIIARECLEREDTDQYEKLFFNSILRPLEQILINSHHNYSEIVKISKEITYERGYNAKTRVYENLYESGLIDPLAVVVGSLKNAVSIAMTILSTECLIVEIPQNQNQ